jgi:hypothetical protein
MRFLTSVHSTIIIKYKFEFRNAILLVFTIILGDLFMMMLIKSFLIINYLMLANIAVANDKEETNFGLTPLKNAVSSSWDSNVKPLVEVAGETWASLITSATIDPDQFTTAIKETWSKTLQDSAAGEEISGAGSAINNFITREIDTTSESATESKKLLDDGKFVDSIWYLSTHFIKNTDDNLAKAVQESELINTIGKITATSYGGPPGAAAYASWYAYKETKDPELALRMGIMSGTSNAGFGLINQDISTQVKNKILSGVMAGLTAAISGEDEQNIKNAFLNSSLMSLTPPNQTPTTSKIDTHKTDEKIENKQDEIAKPIASHPVSPPP